MPRGEVTIMVYIYLFPFTLLEITQLSKRKKNSQSAILSPEDTSTAVYFIFIVCLAQVVRVLEMFWGQFSFSSIEKTGKYFLFHHSSLIHIPSTPVPLISPIPAQGDIITFSHQFHNDSYYRYNASHQFWYP